MSNHHKIPLILDVSLIGMEFNEFFKVNSLIQDGFIETFKDRNRYMCQMNMRNQLVINQK